MNAAILRRIWRVIETTPLNPLLRLNDSDLVQELVNQIDYQSPLSEEDTITIRRYLTAKTRLIRDIA